MRIRFAGKQPVRTTLAAVRLTRVTVATANLAEPKRSASRLADTIRYEMCSGAQIEHMTTRSGPHGIDIAIFSTKTDPAGASLIAYRIVNRALRNSAFLRSWAVISVRHIPIADLQ